jgi:hypothetical protein
MQNAPLREPSRSGGAPCAGRGTGKRGVIGDQAGGVKAEKERSSFLKKSSKRLLLLWVDADRAAYPEHQKFSGAFFQKSTAFT